MSLDVTPACPLHTLYVASAESSVLLTHAFNQTVYVLAET